MAQSRDVRFRAHVTPARAHERVRNAKSTWLTSWCKRDSGFIFSLSQTQQKHIHIQLCPYMERRHGTPTMALTYVATGAAATLASVCFSRAPAAGASGALFGLLGMECASEALAARRHGAGHAEHAMAIARVTGFALALGLVIPGLDNAGHVGGTVSGALCG